MNSIVDPQDYALWPTMKRLLRLWWAERRLALLGLACAFVYTTISVAIPLLFAQAIDHSIVHHSKPLWPYLAAIIVLAAIRFAINFTRRFATAAV